MALYTCGNRGKCVFADGRKRFTWAGRGSPVCPGCGRSEYVSAASAGGVLGLFKSKWVLAIPALALVWHFMGNNGSSPSSAPPQKPANITHNNLAPPNKDIKQVAKADNNETGSNPSTTISKILPILNPELFGMIEIGAKGVKGIVVDMKYTKQEAGCEKDEDTFADCVRRSVKKQFDPKNVNPLDKVAIPDTALAAKGIEDEMTGTFRVDPRHIYLVGSSSIGMVKHRDQLQEALEDKLNKRGEMAFVTPEQEGEMGFRGVLNLIPEKWREKRRSQAIVIDIGSGDTKGGYMEISPDSPSSFIPVSVPWGTKKFTEEVDKQRGETNFAETAAKLRAKLIRPAVQEVVSAKQGMSNKPRVYLIGGIAWAATTLIKPKDQSAFPRIQAHHFDNLYDRVILPNALYTQCDENPLREENPNIKKVCNTFTMDNIIAGLEILKTFSQEMEFAKKTVFFIRDSLYAWPLGYISKRCEEDNQCNFLSIKPKS